MVTASKAPVRRGRKPQMAAPKAPAGFSASKPEAKVPDHVPVAATEPMVLTKRRRRSSVGGHAMKLSAPERPGFVRRWFNDNGNRIADAVAEFDGLGYDYVTDTGAQSSDPSSRISRLVGTKPNGEPLRSYLLETPDELYAEGVAEREQIHGQVDQAIVKGSDFTGEMDERFSHPDRHGSIRIER